MSHFRSVNFTLHYIVFILMPYLGNNIDITKMSAINFSITEHTIPAGHIREYAGSTANSQEEVLHLHVKQYRPLEKSRPLSSNAVTIIAAHGVGLAKVSKELSGLSKDLGILISSNVGTIRAALG